LLLGSADQEQKSFVLRFDMVNALKAPSRILHHFELGCAEVESVGEGLKSVSARAANGTGCGCGE
jgi:hypothetical protein